MITIDELPSIKITKPTDKFIIQPDFSARTEEDYEGYDTPDENTSVITIEKLSDYVAERGLVNGLGDFIINKVSSANTYNEGNIFQLTTGEKGQFLTNVRFINSQNIQSSNFPIYYRELVYDISQENFYICKKTLIKDVITGKTFSELVNEYFIKVSLLQQGEGIEIEDDRISVRLNEWEQDKLYKRYYLVVHNDQMYLSTVEHTSTEWDNDVNNGYWISLGSGGSSGAGARLEFTPGVYYSGDAIVVYQKNLYQRRSGGLDLQWIPENWVLLTNNNISGLFIRYSHVYPNSNSDMQLEPAEYIGIASSNNGIFATAPTEYTSYSWYKIKGADANINLEADALVITYLLNVNNWTYSGGIYSQSININTNGLSENDVKILNLVTSDTRPIVDIEFSNNAVMWEDELKEYSKIFRVDTSTKEITFSSREAIEKNFSVKIRINGDINENSFVTHTELQTIITNYNSQIAGLQEQISRLNQTISSLNSSLENTLEGGN